LLSVDARLDNVTHTLVGALLGEAASRTAHGAANDVRGRVRRSMFMAVMIVGSNLPDSDLLYSLGDESRLSYLLEHRGHTHTVIGALVGSALILVACALWERWKRIELSGLEWLWLTGLAMLAPLLHVAMDALNTYGVHPWWPIDNRWYYGDSVFIVEPLFWASAASLVFLLRSLLARGLVVLCLSAAVYLAFTTGIVNAGSITLYCALALAMLAVGRYARPRVALSAGLGAALVISVGFDIAHRHALDRVDQDGSPRFPGWRTLDRVMTPLPMNPLCWEVILVQAQGERYALRRAVTSVVPSLGCPSLGAGTRITAPLQRVEVPDTTYLRWRGEIVGSRERLRELAAASCEVNALLRFARAPWYQEAGARRVIGDLRYDREPELGFAELDLALPPRCPSYVPPWVAPRMDLLRQP